MLVLDDEGCIFKMVFCLEDEVLDMGCFFYFLVIEVRDGMIYVIYSVYLLCIEEYFEERKLIWYVWFGVEELE